MGADPKRASRLRRSIHKHAHSNDAEGLNSTLEELYHSLETPLSEERHTPLTFAPIVEATLICIYHGHEQMKEDMVDNIRHLWRGYGLSEEDAISIESACESVERERGADEEDIQEKVEECLSGSSLDGKVKVFRHWKKNEAQCE